MAIGNFFARFFVRGRCFIFYFYFFFLDIFFLTHSQEDPWVRAAAAAGALTASPLAHAPAPITHGAQQRRMAQLDYRYLHDPAHDGGSFDASTSAASASLSSSSQSQPPRNRQTVALASTLCLSPRHMTTTATTTAAATAVSLVPAASVVSPAAAAATGATSGAGAANGAATKAFFNHVPPPPADAFAALLPKSAVPHITGNFISWGAPLPMIPLVRARAARPSAHEHHQSSSSSSSPGAHGDDADAAGGGEEGGDSSEGGGGDSGGTESSSPQAAPRVRIDAKFAGASPPSAASSSSASSSSTVNGMRSPRPQMLRGLDPSVGEEDVLTAADRDEYIERGAYAIDLWMPPGAELLFRCA